MPPVPPAKIRPPLAAAAVVLGVMMLWPANAHGQRGLDREQRATLSTLRRDAARIGGLIRRGKTDEAATKLAEAESAFETLKKEAGDALTGRAADRIADQLKEARDALPAATPGTPALDDGPAGRGAGTPATAGGTPMAAGTGPSFRRDVAPTLVNICGRCHMGGRSRGGFSMNTFKELMDSGFVDPEDAEGGHMAFLMGKGQPKMPPGNQRLLKKQWEDTRDWALAGAVFDGTDVNAPLRTLVPTEAEKRAAEVAKLSDEDLLARRRERAAELFRKGRPRETANTVELPAAEVPGTGGLVLTGNVPEDRLRQLAGWVKEDAPGLATLAGPDGIGGRGPLTVFVVASRFGYEDFHMGVHRRDRIPKEMTADATVSADGVDAYLVLQDLRDDATADDLGMRANLIAGLAEAAVEGRGTELPPWLAAGLGPAAAKRAEPRNPALAAREAKLPAALARVRKPEDLLNAGTFSPDELPAVGAAVLGVLRKNGGDKRLAEFLDALARTGAADGGAAALAEVYRATPAGLAREVAASVRRR